MNKERFNYNHYDLTSMFQYFEFQLRANYSTAFNEYAATYIFSKSDLESRLR